MRSIIQLVSALVVILPLYAAAVAAPVPASDRIVMLISVDGLANYYLDDPAADMPTVRKLAAEGARATGGMRCSLPTVTWPNHTTLITGVNPARHGVISNWYLDRATGNPVQLISDPLFNADQIVRVPTIYELAKSNGLKTAALIWPATRGAKALDWTVPDVNTDDLVQQFSTPSLLAECKAAGIPYERHGEWTKARQYAERDVMLVRMIRLILREHRPNLFLYHLDEVDEVEHNKGPQSPEAYASVKSADDRIGEVWDELKRDFPDRATLIVVSDHGFLPYQKQIQLNVLFRKEGLLTVRNNAVAPGAGLRAVAAGGSVFIYALDPANHDALVERAVKMLKDIEGVELIISPSDFPKYGLADPRQDPRAPDLVVSCKSGYSFTDTAIGELIVTPKMTSMRGAHGHDQNLPEMRATFVAWGHGIQPGTKLDTAQNLDVAPTIARLLGLQMKDVEGKVLDSILTP
jgi:predicted AlkP superfamily pyrophosphatase or phosphodiesterase